MTSKKAKKAKKMSKILRVKKKRITNMKTKKKSMSRRTK